MQDVGLKMVAGSQTSSLKFRVMPKMPDDGGKDQGSWIKVLNLQPGQGLEVWGSGIAGTLNRIPIGFQ